MSFNTIDYIVFASYILLVAIIIYSKKTRKENQKPSDSNSKKSGLSWITVGASLFASAIGTEHVIALSGAGAQGNFVFSQFEILAVFMLLALGWIFAPYYFKAGVFSMPDFLEKRYSESSRKYLILVSIVTYIIAKISLILFAGAKVIEVFLGLDFWSSTIFIIGLTGLISFFIKIKDTLTINYLQIFLMLLGAVSISFLGVQHLGGFGGLKSALAQQSSINPTDFFNLWRSTSHSEFPWPAIVLGAPILGIWFWCADQYIVKRVMAAKDLSEARKGTIFAGFLKLFSGTTLLFPGIVVFAICSSEATNFEAGFNVLANSEASFPMAIKHLLPTGLKGLIFGALIVGLVSSLSSVFSSCSSLYLKDFYLKENPKADSSKISSVDQTVTIIMIFLAIIWLPVLKFMTESNGLYYSLQQIQAYVSPPIAAVFIFGVFYKKANSKGAIYALIIGGIIGVVKLSLDILTIGFNKSGIDPILPISTDGFMYSVMSINYLYYAFIMFVISSLIMLFYSKETATAAEETQTSRLIYQRDKSSSRKTGDVVWSILVVLALIAIWILFSTSGIA